MKVHVLSAAALTMSANRGRADIELTGRQVRF
jgi:hypothetical protein